MRQQGEKSRRNKNFSFSSFAQTAGAHLVLILVAAFVLLPIIYVIGVSFNRGTSLYSATIFPSNPTLDNYIRLFTETDFLKWYLNSIKVGGLLSLTVLLFVIPTSYAFSRMHFRGRKNMMVMLVVLQMFPALMSMVAFYILLSLIGLLNTHSGLVLVYAGGMIMGNTWLMKGFLDSIPRSLEEAAMLDGANRLQIIGRVIIPLTRPMLVLVAVSGFGAPFGDYIISKIVLTTPDTFTVGLGVFSFIAGDYGKKFTLFAASSLLSGLPISLLYLSLQKTMFEGLKGSVVR